MRRNVSYRALMLVIVLTACCMNAAAQLLHVVNQTTSHSQVDISQMVPKNYQLIRDDGTTKLYAPKTRKAESEEKLVNVTCVFDQPCHQVTVLGKNYEKDFYNKMGPTEQMVCSVPEGNYDFFIANFQEDGTLAMFVKEQVTIDKDTTLNFSYAESTNRLVVNTFKPNGEPCKLMVEDIMTDEVLEEGNINALYCETYLAHKEYGLASIYSQVANVKYNTNGGSITINDVSDNYQFLCACLISADSTWYVSKYATETMKDLTLSNNPDNYILYEDHFTGTASFNPEEGAGGTSLKANITIDDIRQGSVISGRGKKSADGIIRAYIDAPRSKETNKPRFDIHLIPSFVDCCELREIQYIDKNGEEQIIVETEENYTIALPAIVKNDGIEYVYASHDEMGNHSFHIMPGEPILEYPGHPAFSFTDKEKAMPFGSGCPINVFMAQNTVGVYSEGKNSYQECAYIGRYGEIRTSDFHILETELRYNGDVVCENYNDLNQAAWELTQKDDGVVETRLLNKNVMVDGLLGKNDTHIYADWRQEDWTAPTLQALWFKNNEGLIIDRFENGNNGILEFAGGDFNFHKEKTYWFDCLEQTVEVSYAPYGTEDWTALEVDEIPENFYMPGFGYFYRGSLADVKGEAEKGWFDLKIRLTDTSGNWQEQVISPAFRIDDCVATGISEQQKQPTTVGRRYFSLDGKRSTTPQKGLNIVKQPDGSVHKVTVR